MTKGDRCFIVSSCGCFVVSIVCRHVSTSSTQSRAAGPWGVVPGKTSQRFPVDRGVESIVDPWVLLSHQHLHSVRYSTAIFLQPINDQSLRPYHDDKCHICWSKSFKCFWSISGSPVVEYGPGDIEPARRIDGQLPINEILVSFILQHWDTTEDKN